VLWRSHDGIAADMTKRCPWCEGDTLMEAYHDQEWGVPERDARALWEKLILDGFQAGLSWKTILHKREAFREAFEGFDPERVARYRAADVERLLGNPGIIRSRAKIDAAIGNARAFLAIENKGCGFSAFLWDLAGGAPRDNRFRMRTQVPAQTETSVEMAKALKQHGFKFCGPVIVYAFMQATGMVNDHLVGCYRHKACR
jgi:DNA-3-methyladenine glycosylase I